VPGSKPKGCGLSFQANDLEAGIKAIEGNYIFGMQILLRKMGEE
jgi:hypothetical protein